MSKTFFQRYRFPIIIAAVTLLAFILRIRCCFWGSPLQLHPDEGATVNYVIDMLSRHSWEAHTYDRPDHFEIKCDAVIFTLFSWLKYQKPAYEAFHEHKMTFYILARCYTAFFGAALVPLAAILVGVLVGELEDKYQRMIQMCITVLIAFSAVFIQHSAYATPDIVLAFFVLFFTYGMMCYLENGSKKHLYLCMIAIGIGVTIKYPAAILCTPLAGMVIYRACLIDRKPGEIIRYGVISIGMIVFTVFMLAPNLITDIQTVYVNFIEEARPNHLGADGLGFSGNLKFYVRTILSDIGTISVLPFAAGCLYIIAHRDRKWISLSVGLIYWLCMSALSLHWLRWGIPMYLFYMIIVAIGIGHMARAADRFVSNRTAAYMVRGAVRLLGILILLNVVLSGLSIVKYSSLPDMRMVAKDFFDQNGITAQNSLYEGYTPFAPSSASHYVYAFKTTEHGVKVKIEYASKKYFVMSNSFKDRYLAEEERYPSQCAVYRGLDHSYEIVYRETGDGNYETDKNIMKNLINSWKYLINRHTTGGDTITVYDMNPEYVTVQTSSGKYLSAMEEESGAGLQLVDQVYSWVKYEDENDIDTLLSSQSGLALDVTGGVFSPDTRLEMWEAHGGAAQQWNLIEDEESCYMVCGNNLALTYDEQGIRLSEYTKAENQRWIIQKKDSWMP